MHRLGQLALAGALGVTLCSCAQQQAQQQARIAVQPQAQLTATTREADAQCRGYGVTPDTPAYNRCLASVEAAIKSGVGSQNNTWVESGDARTMNKEMGY
jgi:hypothetical protein